MARRKSVVEKYWGYLLFLLIIWGWWSTSDWVTYGPVLALLSVLTAAYFIFRVPLTCGALNRNETRCRNNARGLMFGCNQVREHKRQNAIRRMGLTRKWREINKGLWITPKDCLASLVAITSIISAIGGVVISLVKA